MAAKIGIDVGNYDTKSEHTKTPSSYIKSVTKNELAQDWILLDGYYYSPSEERNNQQTDKTKDDYCLIVSLFAISKELLFRVRKMEPEYHKEFKKHEIQSLIGNVKEISIGVGLPVGILSSQVNKLKDCYMNAWSGGVSYVYNDYHFSFKLKDCKVFPQDFLPVSMNSDLKLTREFADYYIIGMGGGTVDLIPVSNGMPTVESCISLKKGTTALYRYINTEMQRETGETMNYTTIEKLLMKQPTVIDEERKALVNTAAKKFTDDLIKDMTSSGLKLKDEPCIFVGGGALLLREYLSDSKEFVATEFVADINANAKYYAALL